MPRDETNTHRMIISNNTGKNPEIHICYTVKSANSELEKIEEYFHEFAPDGCEAIGMNISQYKYWKRFYLKYIIAEFKDYTANIEVLVGHVILKHIIQFISKFPRRKQIILNNLTCTAPKCPVIKWTGGQSFGVKYDNWGDRRVITGIILIGSFESFGGSIKGFNDGIVTLYNQNLLIRREECEIHIIDAPPVVITFE